MKGVERFKAALGGNIMESMGGAASGGAGGMPPGLAHGAPARYDGVTRPRDALTIPVDKLLPDPDQPRREFDEDDLRRLAESLRTRGQLQPIRVRWDAGRQSWVIVSGERRWRAAGLAGLPSLACVEVKGEPTPDEILEDQLIENCLRADLKPIEQAHAYKALMDRRGLSGRQLAESLHLSHMTVTRALALLELPEAVQAQVEQGTLAPSAAYEVGKLPDPALQAEVARAAVVEGLTRSEVSELVQAVKARRPAPSPRPDPIAFDLGDGITVTVRWKRASAIGAVQALRKAIKLAQGRERPDQAA
jgi:ParB family transcriptional regulator, chromosome partitioning protein